MKRSFVAFIIILMLSSACANMGEAQANALSKPENQLNPAQPTVVQMTETPTRTPLPTGIATMEPTATEEPTTTPTEALTATPTEAVTPPEGFTSMEEAAKLGWKHENGKWEQHIVWTENGEIQFDTITMNLSRNEKVKPGSTYRTPLGTPRRVNSKAKSGYISNIFEYLTSEVEMNKYVNITNSSLGFYIEIETDKGRYRLPDPKSDYFVMGGYCTDSSDKGKMLGGYITLVAGLPMDEVVNQIKFARKPGASLWVIYDKAEMAKLGADTVSN